MTNPRYCQIRALVFQYLSLDFLRHQHTTEQRDHSILHIRSIVHNHWPHSRTCKPPLLHFIRLPSLCSDITPPAVQSDFGEGEFEHAPQLLHGDLEGVFIGVVFDDVVVHVHQDPVWTDVSSLTPSSSDEGLSVLQPVAERRVVVLWQCAKTHFKRNLTGSEQPTVLVNLEQHVWLFIVDGLTLFCTSCTPFRSFPMVLHTFPKSNWEKWQKYMSENNVSCVLIIAVNVFEVQVLLRLLVIQWLQSHTADIANVGRTNPVSARLLQGAGLLTASTRPFSVGFFSISASNTSSVSLRTYSRTAW